MRKYKIPKKDRLAWLKALEGGRYKQVAGQLHSTYSNSYCCLGVYGRIKGIPKPFLVAGDMPSALSPTLQKLYPNCLLGRGNRSFANKLAKMNDSGDYSFKRITKYIRKHTVGV